MSHDEIREIPLDQLHVSEYQARTRNVTDGLDDLMVNIRVHGQLEPITVVPDHGNEGPPWSVIIGQRRFLAHQRLGKPTIVCIVRRDAPDQYMSSAISVSENLIRKDLTDRDLIDACTSLYHHFGSVRGVAQELGLPYQQVRSCIKYERLQPQLKEIVQQNKLDIHAAVHLQDHLEDCAEDEHADLDDSDVETLANELAPLTRAQQKQHLQLHAARRNGDTEAGKSSQNLTVQKPIKQILVTLSHDDHYRLRAWARDQRITQDKAGAQIIVAFLAAK